MAVIVLGMLIILTADIFLVRLLTKIISAALPTPGQTKSHRVHAPVPPVQLAQPTTARLQPAPSVTENTTRFFEHAYRAPAETEDRAAIDKIEP